MTDIQFFEFFNYEFIQRALLAGSFIAIVCSILGVLLVLRRLSLIGDGLAHVTFGGVAIGLLLKQHPIYIAIPIVTLSSLGILKLMEKARMYGDAAIGIVSSFGISVGVMIVSMAGGFNIDLFSFLFGNILSISKTELITLIVLSLFVLLIISFFYNEYFSVTFDEEFAQISGINIKFLNSLLVTLTGVTVVLTIKVVGIMLTSSLLILPAVTALQLGKSFKGTIFISSIVAVVSVIIGIYLSVIMNFPTGASIIFVNFFLFFLVFLYKNVIFKNS